MKNKRRKRKPDKTERKHRLALMLLFSVVIFCVFAVTMAIVGVGIYILTKTGVIEVANYTQGNMNITIIIMAAASVIIGTFLSVFAVNIPLQPFNMLIDGLKRLASGDFSARLKTNSPFVKIEVVNTLTDSFNTLASELENTEMLRSDFINNFSHEFKTPIVSIAGFAKLLKRGRLSQEQEKEYLDIIEEESLRLSYLATNILNLTKVENQTILTEVTSFNLSEQLRNCVLMLEDKWVNKNLDIRIDIDEHFINANEELLKQVWINLLDNAVKFANVNGFVSVDVKKENGKIAVSILNSGSSINEENKHRIFNKFFQEECSHSSQGNGIGLAVVKRVVELHGGDVEVESKENETCFTVKLPEK